ncbi:HAMP domain-containing protein [Halobacillus litoralis]|uniref:sensor histidine kinase n=1 Tax=Halobacillus litoralis TaxID=45668 RepID=UPI001CD502ED|nr:HAMP domain-containing sensor histidine kinase [Halobacillus litoralis]MCA0970552.1 HAMP domain-containing protein [Halobacillus litoralis]
MTVAFVSISTVGVGFGLTFYLYERFYVDNQKDLLLLQGRNLEAVYQEEGNSDLFQERLKWVNEDSEAEALFVQNPMKLSASLPYEPSVSESFINFEERQQLLQGETVTLVRQHAVIEQDILAVAVPLLEGDRLSGAIFLYMPLDDVYQPFESIRYILLGVMGLILLVTFWGGRKVANQLVLPLRKMEAASKKMAGGDFSKRIHVSSTDEMGSLASSFNQLAKSLEEVEENRREFLQNVSHELRTPLSYMRGYTEAIMEGDVEDAEKEKYIRIIHQETDRLTRLVHDLLDLAQLEGDSYPMRLEPIPFAQLVHDVVDRFRLRLSQKEIPLKLDLDEEAVIEGDPDRLEQVFSNLLDNALRYSEKGQLIEVKMVQKEGKTVLVIKDHGKGIPVEDLEKITDRFYRVQKSRTREAGGSGLGLAIVNQIVTKHGADITFRSTLQEGTEVSVVFDSLEMD